ncbi:MAG: hypothetical protein R2822_02630 [Spirosomataceae bacterium]
MESLSNKTFVRNVFITVITSVIVAIVCFHGPTVHLPFLVGLVVAIFLGWLQPHKGWLLAIIQIVLTAAFYFLIAELHLLTPFNAEATRFTALLQFFPVFTGSFLGAYIRRTF